jgi:hypothetical protein
VVRLPEVIGRVTEGNDAVDEHAVTRRALIGASAALAASITVGGVVSANDSEPTYALDPTQGGACTGSCSGCRACTAHGANKIFQTHAAAVAGRAHAGCQCSVIVGEYFSSATTATLFAASPVADRRSPLTAQALAADADQRSVPMLSGVAPAAALVAGVATAGWIAFRRRAGVLDG